MTTSAATACASNHVTCEQGGQNNYMFGILNPTLPIHYFYDTTMMIKGRLHVRFSPLGGF